MKIGRDFLYLLFSAVAVAQTQPQGQPAILPDARVSSFTIGAEPVTVVHVRPGYVSSVRVPEEVSSVAVGDPKAFDAEHSEAEPRLVFLRPLSIKPMETNVLISTKAGHEIPLHVISDGKSPGGQVDFFLDYQRPHTFLVPEVVPQAAIAETTEIGNVVTPVHQNESDRASPGNALKEVSTTTNPNWQGKELKVAIGATVKTGQQMTVAFSVKNDSDSPIELLPPQVQMSAESRQRHDRKTKAEQMAINQYQLTTRELLPGRVAEGYVVFNRPAFKESDEQLLLQVARADQVDRPVLVPIVFTAPERRGL